MPRALIIAGLALVGVGAAVYAGYVVDETGWPSFSFDKAALIGVLLGPLFYASSTLAFWWMTKLAPTNREQRRPLRNGFLVFGVAGILSAAICGAFIAQYTLFPLSSSAEAEWLVAQYSIEVAGYLMAAASFFALARALSGEPPSSENDELAASLPD
jgi:hypothetical protein